MSDGQFLFFQVNFDNEDLLKAELSLKYPWLNLSYSRHGFLTYKNMGEKLALQDIAKLSIIFSRRFGLSIGRSQREGIERMLSDLIEKKTVAENTPRHLWTTGTNEVDDELRQLIRPIHRAERGEVLNIIQVRKDEFWFGLHWQDEHSSFFPGGDPGLVMPGHSPSRAYLKIAEVDSEFELWKRPGGKILELGSSPGGASLYLIERGQIVLGVDPGEMDARPLEFKDSKRFKHLHLPVQSIKRELLADEMPFHWLVVDMNLSPKQSLSESLRLAQFLTPALKGIVMTVKITDRRLVSEIPAYLAKIRTTHPKSIITRQLATHRREFLALILY